MLKVLLFLSTLLTNKQSPWHDMCPVLICRTEGSRRGKISEMLFLFSFCTFSLFLFSPYLQWNLWGGVSWFFFFFWGLKLKTNVFVGIKHIHLSNKNSRKNHLKNAVLWNSKIKPGQKNLHCLTQISCCWMRFASSWSGSFVCFCFSKKKSMNVFLFFFAAFPVVTCFLCSCLASLEPAPPPLQLGDSFVPWHRWLWNYPRKRDAPTVGCL